MGTLDWKGIGLNTLQFDSILAVLCGIAEDRGVDRMASGNSNGTGVLLKFNSWEGIKMKVAQLT